MDSFSFISSQDLLVEQQVGLFTSLLEISVLKPLQGEASSELPAEIGAHLLAIVLGIPQLVLGFVYLCVSARHCEYPEGRKCHV